MSAAARGGGRRGPAGVPWRIWGLGLAVAAFLLLVALDWFAPAQRTWVIAAETRGASITFKGGSNAWLLGDVIACTPRATPTRGSAEAEKDAVCDPRRYGSAPVADLVLRWAEDDTATLRLGRDHLEIHLGGPVGDFAAQTVLFVPRPNLPTLGALAFSGTVRVGTPMSSGATDAVLSGQYEVREIGFIAAWIRSRTETIKQGALIRGDVVSVIDTKAPDKRLPGFGHVSLLSPEADDEALSLVFLAGGKRGALEVFSYGQAKPTTIEPDWFDRAIANPFPLIVVFLVSFIGSALQLVQSIGGENFWKWRRPAPGSGTPGEK